MINALSEDGENLQNVIFGVQNSEQSFYIANFSFNLCSVVGPINPKDPSEAFCLQLWLLRRLGLWAPETDSQIIQTLYTVWSYFYRWFFLYTYTTTQILFFMTVESLAVSNLKSKKSFLNSTFIMHVRTLPKAFFCCLLKSRCFTKSKFSIRIGIGLRLVKSYSGAHCSSLRMKRKMREYKMKLETLIDNLAYPALCESQWRRPCAFA